MRGHIGKLGGYAIFLLVLTWCVLAYAPRLIDAPRDIAVVGGIALYIIWATSLAIASIDVTRTIRRMRRK